MKGFYSEILPGSVMVYDFTVFISVFVGSLKLALVYLFSLLR